MTMKEIETFAAIFGSVSMISFCTFSKIFYHNANNALYAPPEPVSFDLRPNHKPPNVYPIPTLRKTNNLWNRWDSTTRWFINNPQLLPEVFKSLPGQWFGEYISNLFLRRNILQLDLLFKHLFPEKMILDQYVLGLWMHDWVLWNADCTCIIT